MQSPLLTVENLVTTFATAKGTAHAVDRVSLDLAPGQTLAVVGESGCGKTVLALSVMGLVPDPPGRITSGRILYKGRDMVELPQSELRHLRGPEMAMVFQEPMTSLNPVINVGEQIAEGLRLHKGMDKRQALDAAAEMLAKVGIPNPERRLNSFPHELSGGMRQRVMIAMALSCDPDLLIADEPTTALDVTIQAQILELMGDLLASKPTAAALLITHDLGVVAQLCDTVAVMYAGRMVETAPTREIYADPWHPYTKGLMRSVPRLGKSAELSPIRGTVPGLFDRPQGCRFHPRCAHAFDKCKRQEPELVEFQGGRKVRCWLREP